MPRQIWVSDLGTFVTVGRDSANRNKLQAEAGCRVKECKYWVTVRGKSSENKAVEAIRQKLRQHTRKCPTK